MRRQRRERDTEFPPAAFSLLWATARKPPGTLAAATNGPIIVDVVEKDVGQELP